MVASTRSPAPRPRPRPGSPGTGGGGGRRQPQQERSRAKVDAILDAADGLVAERGVEHLTTTLVAERAGVAVGSLYQYFDGVPAIIDELVARHAEHYRAQLHDALAAKRLTRKRDAANTALDALIDYYRTQPGFRGLWRGAPRAMGAGFGAAGDALVALVIDALVDQGLVTTIDDDLARELEVQWAVAAPLIELAFRRDPAGDPTVLAHLRRLWDLDVRPVA